MLNEILGALFTEFDETTPQNVPHGKQAISLIFNDLNRNMPRELHAGLLRQHQQSGAMRRRARPFGADPDARRRSGRSIGTVRYNPAFP